MKNVTPSILEVALEILTLVITSALECQSIPTYNQI